MRNSLKLAIDTEALAQNISRLKKDLMATGLDAAEKEALKSEVQKMIELLQNLQQKLKKEK